MHIKLQGDQFAQMHSLSLYLLHKQIVYQYIPKEQTTRRR